MTLEELLECSADILKAMSDEELAKHFEPYFNITRPERVARVKGSVSSVPVSKEMQMKLAQLKSLGIDVSLASKKKR